MLVAASGAARLQAALRLFTRVDNLCEASYQEALGYQPAPSPILPHLRRPQRHRWDLGQAFKP